MASKTKVRGVAVETILKDLADTVGSEMGAKETLKVAGVEMTGEKLSAKAAGHFAMYTRAEEKQKEAAKAVADRNAAEPEAVAFAKAGITALEAHFGPDPVKLSKLGVPPVAAKKQLSAKEKTAATERAKDTRALRHTMGPRQKEGIKAGPVVVTVAGDDASSSTGTSPANTGGSTTNGATAPAANGALVS